MTHELDRLNVKKSLEPSQNEGNYFETKTEAKTKTKTEYKGESKPKSKTWLYLVNFGQFSLF